MLCSLLSRLLPSFSVFRLLLTRAYCSMYRAQGTPKKWGRASTAPDKVGNRLCPVWGPNPYFQTAGLLPRFTCTPEPPTLQIEMLVPRAPENSSGKGRKLRGTLSSLKSLNPWVWLVFNSFARDVMG